MLFRSPARITAVHRERCALVCEHGEGYGRLKKGAYYAGAGQFPTVGDFVLIDWSPAGDSRILRTLPRRTYFFRRAPLTGGEQAVAANCDWVFVMQSMNQNFNLKRLERYLAVAWQSGAEPVVVLTKADLAGDPGTFVRAAQAAAPGAAVYAVSARTGQGLEALNPYLLPGKTIAFLGSSGVGKRSEERRVGKEC